jgi:integrase
LARACRSDARRLASEARRNISTGVDPTIDQKARRKRAQDAAGGFGTLGSLIEAYFETGDGKALRTRRMQRTMIEAVWRGLLKRPGLDIRIAELQLVADAYRSASSAARAVGYLRPFVAWAVTRELMTGDSTLLKGPLSGEVVQRVLSHEELGAFLCALGDDSHSSAARYMLQTGARCGEACAATWREIELTFARWVIPHAKRKDTRSARTRSRENGRDHSIPLSRQTVALLRTIGPRGPDDLVFVGAREAPLRNWTRWCRRIEKRLGFRLTIHSLRRTCATMAGDTGAEPHVIAALLGHRVGGSLLARYAKSRYEPQVAEALQRVADRLDVLEAGGNVVPLPSRNELHAS